MYLLTKYIKSLRWGVAIRLSYKQDARCLMVNAINLISNKYVINTVPIATISCVLNWERADYSCM